MRLAMRQFDGRREEALNILQKNHIPFDQDAVEGITFLLPKNEVDAETLRCLGFRISRLIGSQWVISYKGERIGLIA